MSNESQTPITSPSETPSGSESPVATQQNSFFNFLGISASNVTSLVSTLESGANELVEYGRRSGLAEKASGFVETAKENALELAKQAQEMKQSYERLHSEPIHTNPHISPVTVNKELDITYITENILAMAFPYDLTKVKSKVIDIAGNDIVKVVDFLESKHKGHYMIWNISEEAYDYSFFNDQVLDYKFPGHPAPPLGLMFKICTSIESWLDADVNNIAVVHCYTGKGRTATLLSCVLCWIGEFTSPIEALQYISERKSISPDKLTIPSQRRYIQYFSNMIDGVKPRSEPLLLRRVIMNSIPIFSENKDTPGSLGCRPYIQLFKNGKLIATAAPQQSSSDGSLAFVDQNEGVVVFNVDCPVQGDILIRCRHADDARRVSVFRAGFHTGYVPVGVLRLTRTQLDGPSSDARFREDFFIDLIFAPVIDASTTNNTSMQYPSDMGLSLDKDTAEACEDFMHRDVRFWEAIQSRQAKSRRRASRKYLSSSQEKFSISDDTIVPDTALSPLHKSLMAMTKTQVGISNEDLIAELSRAEAETEMTTPPPKVPPIDLSRAKQVVPDDLAFLDDFEFQTPATVQPVGTTAHSELKALEDLERELGLEEFVLPKHDNLSQKKIVQLQSAVEDDLAELESYLSSLSTGSKNTPLK